MKKVIVELEVSNRTTRAELLDALWVLYCVSAVKIIEEKEHEQ